MKNDLVLAIETAPVSVNARSMSQDELEHVRRRFGSDLPEWFLQAMLDAALFGTIYEYSAEGVFARLSWLTGNEMIDEAEIYPGIDAVADGYIPVGTCTEGSGDSYFVCFRSSDDPPLVQIYHDMTRNGEVPEGALRTITTKLSIFFQQAVVLS